MLSNYFVFINLFNCVSTSRPPVDNYLVLYIPDDDTQVVTIIRVMYGGRDVDTQLNRCTKTNEFESIYQKWLVLFS